MNEQAFSFVHPQYGRLRVISSSEGLFYYLRDVIRIYGKSGKQVFETLADSNGRIAQFMIVMAPYDKKLVRSNFLTDKEMGWRARGKKNKSACEFFIDWETLADLELQLDVDGKWGKRWIHEFVEPVLTDVHLAEQHRGLGVVDISFLPPTLDPINVRYNEYLGFAINNCSFGI